MKLEDLLRMAFNDGKRYGQGNTNLNFKQHFESTEYIEAIKLVKKFSIPVVMQSCDTCKNLSTCRFWQEAPNNGAMCKFYIEHVA